MSLEPRSLLLGDNDPPFIYEPERSRQMAIDAMMGDEYVARRDEMRSWLQNPEWTEEEKAAIRAQQDRGMNNLVRDVYGVGDTRSGFAFDKEETIKAFNSPEHQAERDRITLFGKDTA
jgi:hypothetical protein